MAKTIPAGEVKWADILQEVRQHEEVVITEDGQPVARVVPFDRGRRLRSLEELRGSVTIHGDLVAPLDEEWEANE